MNFKVLTSLRFFAAMIIVVYHFKDALKMVKIESYTHLFSKSVTVEFFFILSGFVLSYVYIESIKNNKFKFSDFLIKRLARIYPIHLATLLFFILLGIIYSIFNIAPMRPERYDPGAIISNILLVHAWGFEKRLSFNFPSWTVSAEWFSYLIFYPFILFVIKLREKISILSIISIAIFALFWYISVPMLHRGLTHLTYDFSIIRVLPEFIFGIVLYLIFVKFRIKKFFIKPLLILSLLIFIVSAHFNLSDIFCIISYCILIYSAAEITNQGLTSILNNRVLIYLGNISYSIYLTHTIVLTVYFNTLKLIFKNTYGKIEIFIWLFSFFIVIGVSIIAYELIEKPARKFINDHFTIIFK
jgi:peptidoglycan/LPS O-acetylase OafA/YrhL